MNTVTSSAYSQSNESKMTLQSFYNELVLNCMEGKFPATEENSVECCYRTSDGRACPVGLLISDDRYSPEIENISAYNLDSWRLDLKPEELTLDDLAILQAAHDSFFHGRKDRDLPPEIWFNDAFNELSCFSTVNKTYLQLQS